MDFRNRPNIVDRTRAPMPSNVARSTAARESDNLARLAAKDLLDI
jgi:hypothetical protein